MCNKVHKLIIKEVGYKIHEIIETINNFAYLAVFTQILKYANREIRFFCHFIQNCIMRETIFTRDPT